MENPSSIIPVVIFLGPPGSGKSTHGKRLAREFDWHYLPVGGLVKAFCADEHHKDACSEISRKYLAGIPQSDDVVLSLAEKAFAELPPIKGLILDAFPLSIGQAEAFEAMRERFGFARPKVIFLHASEQIVTTRITERASCPSCGASYNPHDTAYQTMVCAQCGQSLVHRKDDTPAVVHHRYDEYRVRLAPVEEYYRGQGVLTELSGEGHLDTVHAEIRRILDLMIA